MKRRGVVITLLVLVGCAEPRPPEGPPSFQQGYKAGCDSGYVAGGHPYYRFNKDAGRYDADSLYRQGWEDGFRVCKGQYDSIPVRR